MRFQSLKALLLLGPAGLAYAHKQGNVKHAITAAAKADGIDLNCVPYASGALDSIEAIYTPIQVQPLGSNATRIDVHAHVVPTWYHSLFPETGQSPTPNWTLENQFAFMASEGIQRSILSISSPGYAGDEKKTAALARLLNEYLAALAKTYPKRFSFFAVTPLPFVEAAITEVKYALSLGAAGVGLVSNHQGYYLGNPAFTPFFSAVESLNSTKEVVFVHPVEPCQHLPNGTLIVANPTTYPDGLVEFYFETARTFMDLTLSLTLQNFTNLNWILPHAGGSFPSIISRFLSGSPPALRTSSLNIFQARLWFDTAGPTFPFQVQGLLAYGIPHSHLLYGTDYPYVPVPTSVYEAFAESVENATFLTATEKSSVFADNAKSLFAGRI